MPTKAPDNNFENSLTQLENIVKTMESDEIELETALAKFEQGIKLTKKCQKILQDAEQKVQVITSHLNDNKPSNA